MGVWHEAQLPNHGCWHRKFPKFYHIAHSNFVLAFQSHTLIHRAELDWKSKLFGFYRKNSSLRWIKNNSIRMGCSEPINFWILSISIDQHILYEYESRWAFWEWIMGWNFGFTSRWSVWFCCGRIFPRLWCAWRFRRHACLPAGCLHLVTRPALVFT